MLGSRTIPKNRGLNDFDLLIKTTIPKIGSIYIRIIFCQSKIESILKLMCFTIAIVLIHCLSGVK